MARVKFTKCKGKKGIIFSMDAFFAILLFVMITIGIYGYFISFYSLQQQWYMSEDLMTICNC